MIENEEKNLDEQIKEYRRLQELVESSLDYHKESFNMLSKNLILDAMTERGWDWDKLSEISGISKKQLKTYFGTNSKLKLDDLIKLTFSLGYRCRLSLKPLIANRFKYRNLEMEEDEE